MALGPGKYDNACTLARNATGGDVILIVIDGNHGNGFSCQTAEPTLTMLPALLRQIATSIEEDMRP